MRYGDLSDEQIDDLKDFIERHIYVNQDMLVRECFENRVMSREDIQNGRGGAMEWWLIDRYLTRKLISRDELVLNNHHGQWWGRQATGQGIQLDNVIIDIWKSTQ